MNPDNQSYLKNLYENRQSFFNISFIPENNPRSNINVTVQSPLSQFSEFAAAFIEYRRSLQPIHSLIISNESGIYEEQGSH